VNLTSGATTYLVTDSLGSVRGTVNSAGALTGTTSYDAWGNPSSPGGLAASTPFGYAGGYTDPDGLIYLLDRYYNPVTGQFTSVDPDLGQTLQPYEYADGNPVTNVDPTGDDASSYPSCHGQTCLPITGGWCANTSQRTWCMSEWLQKTDDFGDVTDSIQVQYRIDPHWTFTDIKFFASYIQSSGAISYVWFKLNIMCGGFNIDTCVNTTDHIFGLQKKSVRETNRYD
jgi:RHS repeat-associated protein